MSEKLCTLRKKGGGGGKYTETVLWTNPSPSSSFAEQTVTLSQSVDNFKYIAVKYKAHTSSEDSTKFIISTDDLKKGINTTTNHNICFVGSQTSGASYSRIIFYISSTSLSINTAYRTNRAENNNAYAIPLEILGLNELEYNPNDYMVVTGSVNCALGSTVTVDLGFKPKKLTVWRVGSSSLGTMAYYDEDISSSTYTRVYVNGSGSNANSARGLPDTNTNGLCEITDNGFKVSAISKGIAGVYNYTAIGVK